jgi:hypothetical protein
MPPVVIRDVASADSEKSSQVKGGTHHSVACGCVPILIAHASRSATLLRNGRFAFYYLQLLPAAGVAGDSAAARSVLIRSRTHAQALPVRGGGIRCHAGALSSPDQRAAGGHTRNGDAGGETGIRAARAGAAAGAPEPGAGQLVSSMFRGTCGRRAFTISMFGRRRSG